MVQQTKMLARAQKEAMMLQLRDADEDANNSSYEKSRAKIEAVRSVIKRDSWMIGSSRNPQDRQQDSLGREDTQRSILHSVRNHSKVSNFSENEEEKRYVKSKLEQGNLPN